MNHNVVGIRATARNSGFKIRCLWFGVCGLTNATHVYLQADEGDDNDKIVGTRTAARNLGFRVEGLGLRV